jgi:Polyketide cyclase / dehydrase and lipid transport
MRTVSVRETVPCSVHEAETYWYDTARWPAWVEGLARVSGVSGDWPLAGATVEWQSGPAGRGRVTERVLSYEPLAGQTVEVQDDSIEGRQTVTFSPAQDSVEVVLALEYEVRKQSILTPLVDVLFIRGAMERSLRATLSRFAAELAATRQPGVG